MRKSGRQSVPRIGQKLWAAAILVSAAITAAAQPAQTVVECETCRLGLLKPPSILGAERSGSAPGLRGISPCDDDGSTLDVLFLYTANARTEAGGLTGIENAAATAVIHANQHLADSSVPGVEFRMVNLREVSYDEFAGSPSGGLVHLERLSAPSDGFMDVAHTWRNDDRADLVALIVATGANFFGGVGWADVTNPESGFSVCDRLSTLNGTFTHEWGHNLGLYHQCSDLTGYLRYAQGYLWNHSQSGQAYGTAMVGGSAACPRPPSMIYIPLYSNPDLFYLGDRAGIPLHLPNPTHEALAIRETHFAVANFRRSNDAIDCNNNGIADATDIAGGSSQDQNLNGRPDECEIRLYVNKNVAQEGDGLTWATARKELVDAMRTAALPCSNVREIWVAAGTYKADGGTNNRYLRFELGDSVRIFGGFLGGETSLAQRNPIANPTILSGNLGNLGDPADNTSSLIVGYNVGPGTLVDGLTIRDGFADIDGGAAYFENSSPTFRDCLFESNFANLSGGGLRFTLGGSPRIENCRFRLNQADAYGGGAISASQIGTLTIADSLIEGGVASWGSAVAISDSGGLVLSDSDILDNSSSQYTGALDLFNTDATLDAAHFEGNHAATYGGAITVAGGGSALTLTDCTFVDNTAAQWAGAVAVFNDSSLLAEDCTFTDHLAGSIGGGGSLGGAMVVAGATASARMNRCTFDGNQSAQGGGLAVYDNATARLDQCDFIDNRSFGNGGAVDASFGPTLVLSRTRMLGNTAQLDGGGIFTNNAVQIAAVNCVFSGNVATAGGGGAVGLYQSPATSFALCTFASNTSVAAGGALYAWQAAATVSNCIAWNNAPSPVGLFSGGTAAITYSNVQGGFSGAGNINADPLFVNRLGPDATAGTLDDNLRLRVAPTASPSIDAGNASAIPADSLDLDGDANMAEPTPFDLPGFARRIDHPARANTGLGTPPVDMGAYETPCPGDVNGDGAVNLTDLSLLLAHFGQSGGVDIMDGDLNGDGVVNLTDLSILLSRFGASCL